MDDLNKAFEEMIIYFKEYAEKRVQELVNEFLAFLALKDFPLFLKAHSSFTDSLYKQIIFEICLYEYRKNSEQITMYSHVRESNNAPVEDFEKMTYIRRFNKLKTHQDTVFNSLGLNEDNILRLHKDDTKTHYIYPYEKTQYEIMDLIKRLAYKLSEGKFSDSHNYSCSEAQSDLELIDIAYDMIAETKSSYFENCIQYYYLEINYHIETMYRFFKSAKESGRPLKLLKKDIPVLKRILGDVDGVDNTANHTIIGIDVLAEIYRKYPGALAKIMDFNLEINKIRKIILREFKSNNALKYDVKDFITCSAAEDFFKNYIGMRQHIVKDKDYEKDIDIKYFRKIY